MKITHLCTLLLIASIATNVSAQLRATPIGNTITLNWSIVPPSQSQTSPASTYIYRATASNQTQCASVSYMRIATLTAAIGPYNDTSSNLSANTNYCYYVTSVDAQGNESPQSNYSYVAVPASTTCSNTNPCAAISYNNSSMAANPTYNANGSQTAGPGAAIMWYCMGGATGCSQGALNIAIQSLATGGVPQGAWQYTTFSQNAPNITYNDQRPFGSLMNYAFANQWATSTGAIGTAAGPVSAITVYSFPASAPKSYPIQGTQPSVIYSGGGNAGPQMSIKLATHNEKTGKQ